MVTGNISREIGKQLLSEVKAADWEQWFSLMKRAMRHLSYDELIALDRLLSVENGSLNDSPTLLAAWERAMERAIKEE